MRVTGRPQLRLLLSQILCMVFLVIFALSFHVEPSMPAFTGQGKELPQTLLTPSVFDFLWQRQGMVKKVLKMGFPLVGYLEGLRQDSPVPRISLQILGWFMGYVPYDLRDVICAEFPKMVEESWIFTAAQDAVDLEKDWGLAPVLFSLSGEQGSMPVSAITSTVPLVAIYHTHATESYLPEIGTQDPKEAFTTDINKSVVKVGEMLAQELEKRYRIPVLHSKTVHDAQSRLGAYYRSEATVKAILRKYPDCKVLVDVHRDSQPRNLTTVNIRGKSYARMMLVIGTENPNWVSNYTYAQKIISRLEENYPGISRGIFYASAVYNQKYSPSAVLVEVGGVDNTLAECKNSMEVLAWALASIILPVVPPGP